MTEDVDRSSHKIGGTFMVSLTPQMEDADLSLQMIDASTQIVILVFSSTFQVLEGDPREVCPITLPSRNNRVLTRQARCLPAPLAALLGEFIPISSDQHDKTIFSMYLTFYLIPQLGSHLESGIARCFLPTEPTSLSNNLFFATLVST